MRRSRVESLPKILLAGSLLVATTATAAAHETGQQHVHFQKPQRGAATASSEGVTFRSASGTQADEAPPPAQAPAPQRQAKPSTPSRTNRAASPNPLRASAAAQPSQAPAQEQSVVRAAFQRPAPTTDARSNTERTPSYVTRPEPAVQRIAAAPQRAVRRDAAVRPADGGSLAARFRRSQQVERATYLHDYCAGEPACGIMEPGCGLYEPTCGCGEPSCGICEPGCGIYEPTCGCGEPSCGICEPDCGIYEPGCAAPPYCDCGEPSCGICEPGCGIAECGDGIGCGSCVDGGCDYFCFPVCLPKLRDLRLWGGVHGFKGPRDSPAFGGDGDGNFGFQEGVNIAGRAPIVGRLFPGIAYQLGYQAVQSQLSGTSGGSSTDRSQQFVTAGLFRRVPHGLQFGCVWDLMRDDFMASEDFQQIRYEISLKSPKGREIGFLGTTHTNDKGVAGVTYQAVDQYVGFLRWNYRHGGNFRIWGGGSNDSEGILGAEVWFPATDRWSIQTGFNYLIPDENAGTVGAREESWNIGINFFWHFDCTAKKNAGSMFQPLFNVADNGSFFLDEIP